MLCNKCGGVLLSSGTERRDEEHELQVSVAKYLDLRKLLWCHVPNEGRRTKSERGRLLAAGMKSGVPDVMIFDMTAAGAPGSASELKKPGGKPTENQTKWLLDLEDRGWDVSCHDNFDGFRSWVEHESRYPVGYRPRISGTRPSDPLRCGFCESAVIEYVISGKRRFVSCGAVSYASFE